MVCEEYFNRVNKTYSKTFSKRQALPRHVVEHASKCDKILDYGAGKDAFGTLFLRDEGYDCTALEVGSNFNPELHDKDAITRDYDVVFASNVLNVQSSVLEIVDILLDVLGLLKKNGKFICNFPKKPRHSDVDEDYIDALLGLGFKKVTRMENSSPTWVCEGICITVVSMKDVESMTDFELQTEWFKIQAELFFSRSLWEHNQITGKQLLVQLELKSRGLMKGGKLVRDKKRKE